MIIFKKAKDLFRFLNSQMKEGKSIGFVPTMGALHQGHLSLLKQCNEKANVSVCSIFVNPVQFNNPEDLKKYPKTISNDIEILEENDCDVLFFPEEEEIYPDEASKQKHFQIGDLETILEGKFRPGHFQGVCVVMEKLLNIVKPDFLFLGQKDYQQCLVIKRLLEQLNLEVTVVVCPIIREESGLAMSSRNLRLDENDRKRAAQLHKELEWINKNLPNQDFKILKEQAIFRLEKNGFKVEYLELAKTSDLSSVPHYHENEDLILLIAAFISGMRLIDNLLVKA
ncbi:MAG: pantoate--beta-alanine ligase [Ginsengibacter sp.]